MKKEHFLPIFSLVLITFLAYANSLNNAFLNWDDGAYVFENNYLKGVTIENIKHLVSDYYVGEWFPLQMLSYLVDYQIWGLNVIGYHLQNLLWHTGSVILLYFLFQSLGLTRRAALVGGGLFAIFPPSVEAVSWISQRKSVLSMFFMLLSLFLYIKNRYFYSFIAYLPSLLSKTTSVPFAGVLFFYEIMLKGDFSLRSLTRGFIRILPFFILSIVFLGIFVHGQGEAGIIATAGFSDVILESFIVFLFSPVYGFISKVFLPVKLNPFYPPISSSTITPGEILITAIIWIFLFIPIILSSLRNKERVFWLTYYLTIAIPIFVLVAMALFADVTETSPNGGDRHLYFLYPAFIGFLFSGHDRLLKKRIFIPLILILLSSYFVLTVHRNFIWRSDLGLWLDALKKTPDYFFTQLKAGDVCLMEFYKTKEKKYLDSAVQYLQNSLRLNPDVPRTHYLLGEALENRGDYLQALRHYEESMMLAKNRSPYPLMSMGRIYFKLGRYEEAIDYYKKAIAIDPTAFALWRDKGTVELNAGLYDDAISSFERSISLNYNQYDTHRKLGALYLKVKRDIKRALHHFEESFRQNPEQEDSQMLIAIIEALRKKVDK